MQPPRRLLPEPLKMETHCDSQTVTQIENIWRTGYVSRATKSKNEKTETRRSTRATGRAQKPRLAASRTTASADTE